MSRQLITEYRSELDRIHAASGSKRESVVREAFKDLLKRWGKSRDLIFLAEHEYNPPTGNRCYIDGALVHSIRVPFGYWEAKDTNDVLDEEIRRKTAKGYALQQVPELARFIGDPPTHAENPPAPFVVGADERKERAVAYDALLTGL